ncbi:hypothetical protein A9Q83_11020 [Alphaproteobacteria bacterium 46_93_T64]|nr:hypothetical protein A9Q83_11020 [Alphaproteobacteria bacterium 46_93_T64]
MREATEEILEEITPEFDVKNFMHHLGVELVSNDTGVCEMRLQYQDTLSVAEGVFHVGVIGAIGDIAVSAAAKSAARGDGKLELAEKKLNIFAPAKGDHLIAKAKVIKSGRTLTVVEANIYVLNGSTCSQCAMALVTLISE